LDADNAWSAAGPALLRQILLVLECPALIEPEHSRVLGRLLTVAASLPSSAQHALVGLSLTPGCQIGYMDHPGCHQLNAF
jgi:hypothetical protein